MEQKLIFNQSFPYYIGGIARSKQFYRRLDKEEFEERERYGDTRNITSKFENVSRV